MASRKRTTAKRSNGSVNDLVGMQLKETKPITIAQSDVFDSFDEGYNMFLHGDAGTGKSYCALYLAFRELIKNADYDKIIIIRSAVPSRGVGFLPGTLKEKLMAFEEPYIEITKQLFGRGDAYDILKQKEKVVFLSSSYLRGVTFRNAIVIIDEVQNFLGKELDTTITRIGQNCRVIICGDGTQTDFERHNERQGLFNFIKILKEIEAFDFIEFQTEDIVRSGLVKEYIIAKKRLGMNMIFD